MRALHVSFLCVLAVNGCVRTVAISRADETYPPRPDDHFIEVFIPQDLLVPPKLSARQVSQKRDSEVPKNAKVIAHIDTTGGSLASWAKLVRRAQAKARKLGGDGIVLVAWQRNQVDDILFGKDAKEIVCEVIRWKQ